MKIDMEKIIPLWNVKPLEMVHASLPENYDLRNEIISQLNDLPENSNHGRNTILNEFKRLASIGRLTKEETENYLKLLTSGKDYIHWADTLGNFIKNGPKIAYVTNEMKEILENIDLNVRATEYLQPFETILFVLDKDAYLVRQIKCDCCAGNLMAFRVYEKEGEYKFLPIKTESGGYSIWLGSNCTMQDLVPYSPLRTCLILAMLMVNMPIYKKLSDEIRFKKNLRQSRVKNKKVRNNARARLSIEPTEIRLSSEIKLFRTESGESNPSGRPSGSVRPHWRRGHMRNQVCGKGRKERKLIYVPPVCIHVTSMQKNGSELTSVYRS